MPKLGDLAKLVNGVIVGDSFLNISAVSEIESAQNGSLVFAFNKQSLILALESDASAIVTSFDLKTTNKSAILAKKPRLAMAKILQLFALPSEIKNGIHKTAVIDKTARIGKDVAIGSFVYIGPNVEIGNCTTIYPNVTIYQNVKIGNRCVIHSGSVLGVDGFGFEKDKDNTWIKIPQIGGVLIEDDVEIFSNVCISRATIGNTVIKSGTKIDNLNQIAHNCIIGKNCALASFVGMAGSVTIGDNVIIGGQAGFKDHVSVGENTIITARAGVTKDIPTNMIVSGFPAIDHKEEMKISATLRKLAKK